MPTEIMPSQTGILVIDYQTRLGDAMPQDVFLENARNTCNIIRLAAHIGLPIVGTEQYPKGLGTTVDTIRTLIPDPLPKTTFSAYRDESIAHRIQLHKRAQWIVMGMETHICVYQTVRDLVGAGMTVWVPGNTVVSRKKSDWKAGVQLIASIGGQITSAEAVLFDLLKEGRGDAFKMVSRLIR